MEKEVERIFRREASRLQYQGSHHASFPILALHLRYMLSDVSREGRRELKAEHKLRYAGILIAGDCPFGSTDVQRRGVLGREETRRGSLVGSVV